MKKKKAKSQRVRPDKSRHIEYDYHLPVLLDESVDNLVQNANGIYVDGTLGGGGHAELILSKLDFGGESDSIR